MNNPSLQRFGMAVRPGGVVIINSSLVNLPLDRTDVRKVLVPANAIAMELGSAKAANMVALGAYVGATEAVTLEVLQAFVEKKFASKPQLVDLNLKALAEGYDIARSALRGDA